MKADFKPIQVIAAAICRPHPVIKWRLFNFLYPQVTMPFSRRILLTGMAAWCAGMSGATMTFTSAHRDTIFRALWAEGRLPPAIDAHHVALFRRLRVDWSPIETGAPGINPFIPLLGKHAPLANAREALGNVSDEVAARKLAELNLVFAPMLERAHLAPGRYPIPAELHAAFVEPEWSVNADGTFDLKAEHMVLLRGANWRTPGIEAIDELLSEDDCWPMPTIDGKRPYGDMTFFQADMGRLLGEPYELGADGYFIQDEDRDARLEQLHYQTLPALQILFSHATVVV